MREMTTSAHTYFMPLINRVQREQLKRAPTASTKPAMCVTSSQCKECVPLKRVRVCTHLVPANEGRRTTSTPTTVCPLLANSSVTASPTRPEHPVTTTTWGLAALGCPWSAMAWLGSDASTDKSNLPLPSSLRTRWAAADRSRQRLGQVESGCAATSSTSKKTI